MKKLDEYAAIRDQERWAIALAKTYNSRRMKAYRAYLKEYDTLVEQGELSDREQLEFQQKLEEINQFPHLRKS